MSAALLRAMLEAFRRRSPTELPPHHRLVLVAMADHADDEGKTAQSAVAIARTTGQSRSTVENILPELCTAAWLLAEPRRVGRRPLSTLHVIRTDGGPIVRQVDTPSGGVSRSDTPGAGVSDTPRRGVSPKSDTPSGTPSGAVTPRQAVGQSRGDTPPGGGSEPPPDLGSARGSEKRSDLGGGSSLDPQARVATHAPAPPPAPIPIRAKGEETPAAGTDIAQDPKRRAAARNFLPATDEKGWQIWEILVRSPALREAEDADGSVEPGSLARQANGISGKLMSSGAGLELAVKAAQDTAREFESERDAAGNRWNRPNMHKVSSILSRYFAANLTQRGIRAAPTSTRPPGGISRVPVESGAYDESAARARTKARLRAATEEGDQ